MFRYRKTKLAYKDSPKPKDCPFCVVEGALLVRETSHARIMINKFGYDLWEIRDVTEHLLVMPKRHVASMAELTTQERQEIIDILAEYEAKHYNIYARALGSVQRTVPLHQHTHLIKTKNIKSRGLVFLEKPYWLFKF